MKSILFVCLGNICRSPLAHGIAQKIAVDRNLEITVDSAGTGSWHVGEAPCENSIKVAAQHNIDISHQVSRQVQQKDFAHFDYIIALDESNYNDLKRMGAPNLSKLGMYGHNNEDVPDPYFFPGFEGFDKVYTMIEHCVQTLIDEI